MTFPGRRENEFFRLPENGADAVSRVVEVDDDTLAAGEHLLLPVTVVLVLLISTILYPLLVLVIIFRDYILVTLVHLWVVFNIVSPVTLSRFHLIVQMPVVVTGFLLSPVVVPRNARVKPDNREQLVVLGGARSVRLRRWPPASWIPRIPPQHDPYPERHAPTFFSRKTVNPPRPSQ